MKTKYCCKCQQSKTESEFSKDKQKPDGLRTWCKSCMSLYRIEKGYKSNTKTKQTYLNVDTSDMILVGESAKCRYFLNHTGTIYRVYNGFAKEVVKRLGTRGYCEFKIGTKTVMYHQIVAKYLVPNLNNGNKVFFNSSNVFDTRPQNLRWVWTREHQRLTPQEAIKRTKCRNLISYYKTGNRRIIDSLIPDVLNKIYSIFDRNKVDKMLGELFELFYNYLERCLIFNIENDLIQTLRGLLKQEIRDKVKSYQINERFI